MEKHQKRFLQLMLMLSIGLLIIIPVIIWLAPKPPREYEGVVMEGPDISWIKQGNHYSLLETVKVFSSELGTVKAIVHDFNDLGANSYLDQNLISYSDSYPPAIGKTIKVKLRYNNDLKLIITKAWAD